MKYFSLNLVTAFQSTAAKCAGLLLLFTTFYAASIMAATDQAGTVVFANGRVVATSSDHGERALSKSDPIFNTDRIDTAANGRGQLRFTDGGLVSLMPNTTFSVEEYFYEDDSNADSAVFGLLKGGLRTITGAVGKTNHEEYELRTPVATLGIRGTEYVAVIQPANTLRVHVGRGKVVITNDYGTLEVPEGRNAVVSMDSAPDFTEKGPVFVATAPTGDLLVAGMMPVQDPQLLNPDVDIAVPDDVTFTNTSIAGGGINPGTNPGSNPPPIQLTPMIAGGYLNDDWETASIFNIDPALFDDSGATNNSSGSGNQYLQWGTYSGGTVDVAGTNVNLSDSGLAYVIGDAAVDFMPAGQLNYSLAGATQVEGTGSFSLTKFDLGLDLGNLSYLIDFQLNDSGSNVYQSDASGNLNSGSTSQNFGFDTNNVQGSPGNCTSGCSLAVQGFLAGPNGEAAGVGYKLEDNGSRALTGAAALDRQ